MYVMKKSRKTKRNKTLLSVGFIVATIIYVSSQYLGGASTSAASTAISGQSKTVATVSTTHTTQSAPPPQTKSTASGLYADGSYTGTAENAYYGTLQVKAVISGGKLTDVQFLQYANDRSTSVAINSRAMPVLKSEAIQAQTSNVSVVSGATFTSQAFQQSIHSALTQAQA